MSLSRAARRRIARQKERSKTDEIRLMNPVAHHFSAFIFGNATKCEHVVKQNSAVGQSLAICGAGPSLRDHIADFDQSDQVWGINSALPWLVESGYRVTHGFTIDQTPTMLKEWATTPDVEYLVASTVHPHLVELLELRGRTMRFFHNFTGAKGQAELENGDVQVVATVTIPTPDGGTRTVYWEDWLYMNLYESTVRAGSGLNGATRAIDVALYMGFAEINVLGADCALRIKSEPPELDDDADDETRRVWQVEYNEWLRTQTEFHADGGSAVANGQTGSLMCGVIDGRPWETKPDLAISAVTLARMMQQFEHVHCIGDTLPNALKDKPEEFLRQMPYLTDSEGNRIE